MLEERGVKIGIEVEEEPTKESEVFYNTDMVLNRDVSVSALKVYREDQNVDLEVLDALSATGIRGLRYHNDIDGLKVTMNDSKPEAVENIEENIDLNGFDTEDLEVTGKDANLLMTERRKGYHFIDLDPFGSPARFMDSAARSLKHDSFLGVTATDLASLCGTYTKTCRRRYGAWTENVSFCHEVGLRVLIRHIFESLARFNKVFRPKLSFAQRHYYRVFGTVRESKKGVNRNLEKVGFLMVCEECGNRDMVQERTEIFQECPDCGEEVRRLGPLWIGKLGRKDFVSRVRQDLEEKELEEAAELTRMLEEEVLIRKPYFDTHNLGNITGLPVPRRKELLERIRDKGYNAVRTHFTPTGIRTSCPAEDLRKMVREMHEESEE